MTTIVTKNGSGAPLASDLVQGELAVDLTNKRLYTEDSGGTVIELGSNPTSLTTGTFTSTGIDDNATSTAITIDSSENVGIGTASPGTTLDVVGTHRVYGSGATAVVSLSSSSTLGTISSGASATTQLSFETGGSEAMRIDSSGNVGIGTDTVSSASGYTTVNINGSTGGQIHFSDDDVKIADFTANTGNLFIQSSGVTSFRTGGFGSGDEAMRIDSSGNLLVGTTSSPGAGAAGVRVYNNTNRGRIDIGKTATGNTSAIANFHNGTYVGGVNYSDTATSFPTSSDVRLKENIVDAPAGNIDDIRVRSFDWKADGSHQTYGMVAQELVDVAPEAVFQGETDDDMWGVDYSKLVPMMIKEIQDLKAEVAALKGA